MSATRRCLQGLGRAARQAEPVAVSRTRRARAARRRQRRLAAVDHDLTAAQWESLKAAWQGCAYCGATDRPLQRDCVMAISRGGRYTIDNVVPACASCNTSKCNDEVTGWLRRKRLDERRFLQRYVEIRRALAAADAPRPLSPG
ncbi:HNH endonuclease [Mycolicibacterium flavescens]|uniref:Endonuclease n=1 Tax=Mycolicibacterium flavescens TaxID=1776 RepID=A0A1E3RMY9_MYCFV|nr:HNH endonuclease [Mycolicibacterium flavescens]ODQ91265.1 endonuclease [Mycolicibacterium flavescens]